MNTDKLDLWLTDLRTTDAAQGPNRLTRLVHGEADCCLGRLCKVAIADGVVIPTRIVYWRIADGITHVRYDDNDSMPPLAVTEWLFGDVYAPEADDFYGGCAVLNDKGGATFPEIATSVEAGDLEV